MNKTKDQMEMTLKEFMEWYVKEYEGRVLPSDFERTINMLDGYRMGMQNTEQATMLSSAVILLQDACNFFAVVKRIAKWEYRGE